MVKKQRKEDQPVEGFGTYYDRYVTWVTSLSSGKKVSFLFIGLLLIAVLSAVASVPFFTDEWYLWVQAVIGFPAGVILFAVLVGIAYNTSYKNTEFFELKERFSHNQRLRMVAISAVIIIIIFIFFGRYLPYGVGGTLVVAILLTIYNLMRRTPQEVALARQGIPDPRDVKKGDTDDL